MQIHWHANRCCDNTFSTNNNQKKKNIKNSMATASAAASSRIRSHKFHYTRSRGNITLLYVNFLREGICLFFPCRTPNKPPGTPSFCFRWKKSRSQLGVRLLLILCPIFVPLYFFFALSIACDEQLPLPQHAGCFSCVGNWESIHATNAHFTDKSAYGVQCIYDVSTRCHTPEYVCQWNISYAQQCQ